MQSPPPPRDLLERGGGGAGRGSRGGGEGVQGGAPPPPPCRNIPNPQGTEKLLENEQLSAWKCHVVGRKQRKFIIECQFRVPTSHQYTTTTTKRDIHHLMPNDSDLSCQSELDSPEPVVCGHFLCHSDKLAQCGHWYAKKKCGTCLLCLVVGFLPFMTADPIFKRKIEQRVNYIFTFCA